MNKVEVDFKSGPLLDECLVHAPNGLRPDFATVSMDQYRVFTLEKMEKHLSALQHQAMQV